MARRNRLDRPGWWPAVDVRCGENDGRCGRIVATVYVISTSDAYYANGDLFVALHEQHRSPDVPGTFDELDDSGLDARFHLDGLFVEPGTDPTSTLATRCRTHGTLTFDVAGARDAVARARARNRATSLVARDLDA